MSAEQQKMADPDEVAEHLGTPVKTLAVWRSQGKGPKYYKVGRHVRYRWSDVNAWLEAQAVMTR